MYKKEFQDDYCDIYEKKICDNCGKCLEEEGVDIRAIKIEDIAKKIEENENLEAKYRKALGNKVFEDLDDEKVDNDLESIEAEIKLGLNNNEELMKAYENLTLESGINFSSLNDDKYEDAFDHIEYIADYDLFEEGTLEERTIEVFPGVRRLKGQK